MKVKCIKSPLINSIRSGKSGLKKSWLEKKDYEEKVEKNLAGKKNDLSPNEELLNKFESGSLLAKQFLYKKESVYSKEKKEVSMLWIT